MRVSNARRNARDSFRLVAGHQWRWGQPLAAAWVFLKMLFSTWSQHDSGGVPDACRRAKWGLPGQTQSNVLSSLDNVFQGSDAAALRGKSVLPPYSRTSLEVDLEQTSLLLSGNGDKHKSRSTAELRDRTWQVMLRSCLLGQKH